MRILFCGETFPEARRRLALKLRDDEIVFCERSALREALHGADVVIPLMSRIDRALIEAGSFRLIQQWGAGLEGVDVEAACRKGVRVANVPATGKNADSVAEHVMLLMLALLRDLPRCQANVRKGLLGIPPGKMLAGRTVCLYGLGAIARATARRVRAFDVRLIGISREPTPRKMEDFLLEACYPASDPGLALTQADILVICSRMTQKTRGVIDQAVLRALPKGAYVINAARGGLIDYSAFYEGLSSGYLAGAGLDVYWDEPIAPADPILALPNVIATPHTAGVTDQSYEEIAVAVANNINRLRHGEEPWNCVA